MDRSKYLFVQTSKIEAIQFKGLDENKFDICFFLKGQGPFTAEFDNDKNEIRIKKEGMIPVLAGPTDWIVLKDGRVSIYEDEYFNTKFKKV